MISFSVLFTMMASFLITTLVPIILLIVLGVKKKISLAPLGLGFACFFVSQILLRTPILNLLSQQSWWEGFASQGLFYSIFLVTTSALFEESARLGGAALLKEHRRYWDALSFGMGHAFCEIFFIYSVTLLNNMLFCFMLNMDSAEATALFPPEQAQEIIAQFTAISPGDVFAGLLERISAVFFHLFATVLVFQGVVQMRYWFVFLAMAAHIFFSSAPVFVDQWFGFWPSEIVLLLLGIGCLVYVILQRKNRFFPEPVRRLR